VKALLAQSRAEVVMTLKRGESLLLTVLIPVGLLLFFALTHVTPVPSGTRVDYLAPGIVGLCVMSTALVALSIATGFERSYGVLRRLATTPLGRVRLVGAKAMGVLVVETVQVGVVVAVAFGLGWTPRGGGVTVGWVVLGVLAASLGFAGLGLLLAGAVRAEANLAAANGLYLVLLLVSGFVVPLHSLPHALADVVVAVPSGALCDLLHRTLGLGGAPRVSDLLSLAAWAVAAPALAARTFSLAD
jgi:ABC-2 type transport system permease protein